MPPTHHHHHLTHHKKKKPPSAASRLPPDQAACCFHTRTPPKPAGSSADRPLPRQPGPDHPAPTTPPGGTMPSRGPPAPYAYPAGEPPAALVVLRAGVLPGRDGVPTARTQLPAATGGYSKSRNQNKKRRGRERRARLTGEKGAESVGVERDAVAVADAVVAVSRRCTFAIASRRQPIPFRRVRGQV
ncbi:hypothetical protein C2845_PM12G14530 [Panicum miliaceum]|uniref:Uncharacterized protein n=1 Tax=Panicum miliaceum TaxID=4540 RepID=A0A3L6QCN9_PANMI|nr:hypothetical protein C2845_PM12G14530 [Panicum miliaceum]